MNVSKKIKTRDVQLHQILIQAYVRFLLKYFGVPLMAAGAFGKDKLSESEERINRIAFSEGRQSGLHLRGKVKK